MGAALLPLASTANLTPAYADDGFPFGMEMTLEAAPQSGSKRIPDLDIGDNGKPFSNCGARAARGSFRWPATP